MQEILQLSVLPRHITSDRGLQFASKFYQELNHELNINLRLSIAYHPQTAGPREWPDQILKQYLRIYCHKRQTHWPAWLPVAEFVFNTTSTATHSYSLYQSLYGFGPCTMYLNNDWELACLAVAEWLNRITIGHKHIYDILNCMNEQRSTIHLEEARRFHIDDWVLVDRRNLQVKAGNNKLLTWNWVVPYTIINAICSHAYGLEVTEGTCWYNIVHITLLKPFRRRDETQDMDEDEAKVWETAESVNSRTVNGVVQNRVC